MCNQRRRRNESSWVLPVIANEPFLKEIEQIDGMYQANRTPAMFTASSWAAATTPAQSPRWSTRRRNRMEIRSQWGRGERMKKFYVWTQIGFKHQVWMGCESPAGLIASLARFSSSRWVNLAWVELRVGPCSGWLQRGLTEKRLESKCRKYHKSHNHGGVSGSDRVHRHTVKPPLVWPLIIIPALQTQCMKYTTQGFLLRSPRARVNTISAKRSWKPDSWLIFWTGVGTEQSSKCAFRRLLLAVYFVWSALGWESCSEMWLQHCNFDKTQWRLFGFQTPRLLLSLLKSPQIALLMSDYCFSDLF